MTDDTADVAALQAALGARSRLQGWATGADLITLLRATDRNGWLDALSEGATPEVLATLAGVSAERARTTVEVLVAGGVAAPGEDGSVRLTAEFAALHAGASGLTLPVVLDALEADRTRLTTAFDGPRAASSADALVVARVFGLLPTAAARAMFGLAYDAVPRYRERLAAGGRLLDAGSGVGGALLATLTSFPELRATGVERDGDVAAELSDRARAAGVLDRLEVRRLAVEDLTDAATYETCYWAQAFFAPAVRGPALAAIRRALVPGGLLLTQELTPPPGDDATTARAALDAVVADTRGVTAVRSAEELAQELSDAGFTDIAVVASPVGRLVLAAVPSQTRVCPINRCNWR